MALEKDQPKAQDDATRGTGEECRRRGGQSGTPSNPEFMGYPGYGPVGFEGVGYPQWNQAYMGYGYGPWGPPQSSAPRLPGGPPPQSPAAGNTTSTGTGSNPECNPQEFMRSMRNRCRGLPCKLLIIPGLFIGIPALCFVLGHLHQVIGFGICVALVRYVANKVNAPLTRILDYLTGDNDGSGPQQGPNPNAAQDQYNNWWRWDHPTQRTNPTSPRDDN